MVIVMEAGASAGQLSVVLDRVTTSGFRPHVNDGVERKVIAVLGEVDIDKVELLEQFENLPGVERVDLISAPFKLSSRQYQPEDRIVDVGGVLIGGTRVVIMAGPCSVESEIQIHEAAQAVKEAGARVLRGGAFKPRSSPHSFQGLGEPGLKMLAEAGAATGLPVVTEVMDAHDVELICRHAQMLQIGARNMQNFTLLRAVGQSKRPVLLKRGPGCRIKDLLMAAEYVLCEGNDQVVLCERGITTFEDAARNTTDINAVPILKELSHLPVVLDPSHSTGEWRWVTPIARAAIAAGADGLIIEVHPNPQAARSDGRQSLKPARFAELVVQARAIAEAVGRTL
ncbi:MAG TPA: 3-deoxy-7-phosphoheptulonate synthase [Chloroflexota bacterium]|nr:3-deoxy-7-phosphoheptulonate synthase [Chloroflexota bacterium]